MKINPTIFREYDIRGIIDTGFSEKAIQEYEKWYGSFPGITLTYEAAEAIGLAYGLLILEAGGRRVVVGYEIRPGAEKLKEAFIKGVLHSGCDVADMGAAVTPLVYFTIANGGWDGGVNITGSHNVYFYNGFKMMKKGVWPVFGKELQEMRHTIEEDRLTPANAPGVRTSIDAYPAYKEYVTRHIKLARPLKVVMDAGNGSAGKFAMELLEIVGCEVIGLHIESDAAFPNHIPDPEQSQFYERLSEKVREERADCGIAFDADGDRVGFVDETGKFIESDHATLVFAKDALSRHIGKKVVYDIKSTQLLEELIPKFRGVPVMHKTGHAPIKETLRKDPDVIFAGEKSGHFYFVEDYYRIDDGLWSAFRMLELISRVSTFSSLFEGFPSRTATPEFKLPCVDEKKFEVTKEIEKNLLSRFEAVNIDGVRIKFSETGWGLIRASNTSPYLTVRVEGKSEEEVLKIKNILADELEKFPEITDRLDRGVVARLGGKLGWV